jgi:hypothetical protein
MNSSRAPASMRSRTTSLFKKFLCCSGLIVSQPAVTRSWRSTHVVVFARILGVIVRSLEQILEDIIFAG